MENAQANTKPRIYVACLAAYNNGILHGVWIDADGGEDGEHQQHDEDRRAALGSPGTARAQPAAVARSLGDQYHASPRWFISATSAMSVRALAKPNVPTWCRKVAPCSSGGE